MFARDTRWLLPGMALLVVLVAAHPLAADSVPRNLSPDLRSLLGPQAEVRALAPAEGLSVDHESLRVRDAEGRVLVKIVLDGRQPLDAVRDRIAAVEGARITASTDRYRAGVIEAYVPPAKLVEVANAAGVSSVVASNRPVADVGAVTTQGFVQHRIDRLAPGIDGRGITVGALSDSFDTATSAPKDAADDVASGDLPPDVVVLEEAAGADEGRAMLQIVHDIAPGARLGFATAFGGEVNFAENIRSLAGFPGAAKAVPGFRADVIVDDIIYLAEPFFQDGIVAQAVDEVAAAGVSYFSSAGNRPGSQGYDSKLRLVPGKLDAAAGTNLKLASVDPQLYAGGFHNFAARGNPPDIAQTVSITNSGVIVFQWNEPYDPTPPALTTLLAQGAGATTAAAPTEDFPFNGNAGQAIGITADADPTSPTPIPDVTITLLDPGGTVIGFQDATTNPELLIARLPVTGTYTIRIGGYAGATGGFVWKVQEAVIDQRVASDFNLLFFTAGGDFLFEFAEDNLASNRPIELGGIGGTGTLQLVIARANTPDPCDHPAGHLRYVWFNGGQPQEYVNYNSPVTYGHNSARGASGVAAYAFYPPFVPEAFTSPGPVTIYFDKHNRRLRHPETRQKPDIAAMDGANTTFFFSDALQDPDTFPNFFGTSAAAPHAAGIAALVLQAAGGPGRLRPRTVREYLQESAFMHDLDPNFASGWAWRGMNLVYVTALADGNAMSQFDPNVFTVGYFGRNSLVDVTLKPITGNTTETPTRGVIFDERVGPGQPFVLGSNSGLPAGAFAPKFDVAAAPPAAVGQWNELSIAIAGSAMTNGEYFRFGVDRDEADAFGPSGAVGGNVADILGASVLIPHGTVAPGGATFDARLANGLTLRGTLRNQLGWGYSVQDGYGFVNAEAAVRLATRGCRKHKH